MLMTAPTSSFGPGFAVTWTIGALTEIVQDLYPYATGGPLVHTEPGQVNLRGGPRRGSWRMVPRRPTTGHRPAFGGPTRASPAGLSVHALRLRIASNQPSTRRHVSSQLQVAPARRHAGGRSAGRGCHNSWRATQTPGTTELISLYPESTHHQFRGSRPDPAPATTSRRCVVVVSVCSWGRAPQISCPCWISLEDRADETNSVRCNESPQATMAMVVVAGAIRSFGGNVVMSPLWTIGSIARQHGIWLPPSGVQLTRLCGCGERRQ